MQKLRSYFSVLFLALLLFPMAEKAKHELGHLTEEHCDTQGLHYCALEHTCHICDYVFSSSAGLPPTDNEDLKVPISSTDVLVLALSSNPVTSTKYTSALRGPPVC